MLLTSLLNLEAQLRRLLTVSCAREQVALLIDLSGGRMLLDACTCRPCERALRAASSRRCFSTYVEVLAGKEDPSTISEMRVNLREKLYVCAHSPLLSFLFSLVYYIITPARLFDHVAHASFLANHFSKNYK